MTGFFISTEPKGQEGYALSIMCQCPMTGFFISTVGKMPVCIELQGVCQCPMTGFFISTPLKTTRYLSALEKVSMPYDGLFHFYREDCVMFKLLSKSVNAL